MSEVVPSGFAGAASGPEDSCGAGLVESPGLLELHQKLSPQESRAASTQRLHQDAAIFQHLKADGFTGPRYERYAARLMHKGWLTVFKMTETDEIFSRARKLGRPVSPSKVTRSWTTEDRYEITTDSILAGMKVFHEHALVGGGWRPEGGAGLFSYFVGASIRSFPRVYIRWYDDMVRRQSELGMEGSAHTSDRVTGMPDRHGLDPAAAAATRDDLDRILALIPDQQVREGIAWRSLGYSQAEAAAFVGLSEKALERRLSRVRERVRNAQAGWADGQEGGTAR